ncbi:MAG: hypothetical protein QXD84_06720 [Thermoplasmata archaeon]
MGEEESAGERKGYFARRRERRLAKEEAKLAAGASAPAAPPSTPSSPLPPVVPETRVSLELMREIERRIDRMGDVERRRSLLERYEAKYSEKLEVPSIFPPVEVVEERPAAGKGAVAPSAPPSVASPSSAPPPPAEAATAPPPQPSAPSTPGAPERAPPAPAPPPTPAPATISLGEPAGPAPQKPKKPSPINLRSFWKYLWDPRKFPMRALAKYYSPEKKGVVLAATVVDILIWILLALPRFILLIWLGLIIDFVKKKRSARGAAPQSPVATD